MISIFPKHKIHVKPTQPSHLSSVATRMRQSDVDEIWASNLIRPLDALTLGLKCSTICDTVFKDELSLAIYGIVPNPKLAGTASIWMLGTNELSTVLHAFGSMTRDVIKELHEQFPILYNYVDIRNRNCIAWLKFQGAIFEDPKPYGIAKLPFAYFQIRRKV